MDEKELSTETGCFAVGMSQSEAPCNGSIPHLVRESSTCSETVIVRFDTLSSFDASGSIASCDSTSLGLTVVARHDDGREAAIEDGSVGPSQHNKSTNRRGVAFRPDVHSVQEQPVSQSVSPVVSYPYRSHFQMVGMV